MNIYQEHGFANRNEYLVNLAEDTGVDLETVLDLAGILGMDEDFDGLVTALEDYADRDFY